MPHDQKTEVVVGVVICIALLILIFSIMWGKGFNWFSDRHLIVAQFEDVRALERGDPVFVRGMQKGIVERIELHAKEVEVLLAMDDDVALYSDLKLVVESRELMGGKQITVYPGKSGVPADLSKTYRGEVGSDIQSLFLKAQTTISRADSVLEQVGSFLTQERMVQIVKNMEETSSLARDMLAENRKALRSTVQRIDTMTRSLQEDSTVVRLGDLFTKIDSTVTQIIRLSDLVENEDGTVGKLLGDRWLYDQLLKTAADLDALVQDIQANPKKYIRVSVF